MWFKTFFSLSKKRGSFCFAVLGLLLAAPLSYHSLGRTSRQEDRPNRNLDQDTLKRISPDQYIDEAVIEHIKSLQDPSTRVRYQLAHYIFRDSYAGPMVESLIKHPPLLDKASYRALHVFSGTEANTGHSLCRQFALQTNITGPLAYYHNLLNFASANGDSTRIAHNQALINTLRARPKENGGILAIYQQADEAIINLIMFFARKVYPFPATSAANILHPEKIVPSYIFDLEQSLYGTSSMREALKQSPLSVRTIRHMGLELRVLEVMSELENHGKTIKKFFNTLHWLAHLLSLKLVPHEAANKEYIWDMPTPEHRLLYRGMNFVWKRLRAIFARNWWGVIDGGDYHLDSSNILVKVPNAVFGAFFYVLLGFPRASGRAYELIKEIIFRYLQWQGTTNILLPILKDIYQINKLMRKLNKLVAKNPELKKVCSPHLKKMRKLLRNRFFAKIIKRIAKLPTQPITIWKVINPFSATATTILSTYKRLEGISEKLEEVFRDAVASFYYLAPFASIAYHTYLTEKGISTKPYTPIYQAQSTLDEPVIDLKDAYTPMVKAEKPTPNNVAIGGTGKEKKHNILMTGINGSGKSIFMRCVADNQYIFQTYGVGCVESGKASVLDKMVFCANVSDDASQGKSLMMAEATLLNSLVSNTRTDQSMLILVDEVLKGTPQKEGRALLIATLMELGERPDTIILTSTHLTDIPDLAKKINYKGFTYYTTEYTKEKGLTFKVIPGQIDKPAYIHILKKMKFNKKVLAKSIDILKKDATYKFSDQLPGKIPAKTQWMYYTLALFVMLGMAAIMLAISRMYSAKRKNSRSKPLP